MSGSEKDDIISDKKLYLLVRRITQCMETYNAVKDLLDDVHSYMKIHNTMYLSHGHQSGRRRRAAGQRCPLHGWPPRCRACPASAVDQHIK